MIKKIGVLTSGGDAPGMNCAIRAVVRTALANDIEVYGVIDGYKGLVENNFVKMDRDSVCDIISRGGTILGTARLPEFKEVAVREKAVDNLKKNGIEALVVIGGDGSYMGALRLTEMGINCVGLPGTIDNDIACTEFTIGYDTCLNTIMEAVDRIRDTTVSHQRCAVIEVMGNHCGDLALFSGLAEGADLVITPDHRLTDDEVVDALNRLWDRKRKRAIVIVSEKVYPNIKDFANMIAARTNWEAKSEVLGRQQRGGAPSAFDRILATRMGSRAVHELIAGNGGICIGQQKHVLVTFPIMEALAMPRVQHPVSTAIIDEFAK